MVLWGQRRSYFIPKSKYFEGRQLLVDNIIKQGRALNYIRSEKIEQNK